MSPRLIFFFQIREKREKWDPFHHPIYKTIAQTVLGTCLQSKVNNTKQDKSNFVKKNWGFTIKKHQPGSKNDQNSNLQN